ncbi:MAG: hypothetical protein MUE73_22250, partial [Planctomycetes bacterium]|nr:hypothetical protein [Planctomycetota bacterium]
MKMRSVALLLAIASALVLSMVLVPPTSPPDRRSPARVESERPQTVAPLMTTPDPALARGSLPCGHGAILGRVTRDGIPVPALVEVRFRPHIPDLRTISIEGRLQNPWADDAPSLVLRSAGDAGFVLRDLASGRYTLAARTDDGANGMESVVVLNFASRRVEIEVTRGEA